MICPHCQNDTEKPTTTNAQPTVTLKQSRVRNLCVNAWCPLCKKAKGWSGILVMGSTEDDAETLPVPETCMCHLFNNNPQPLFSYWNTNAAAIPDIQGTIRINL